MDACWLFDCFHGGQLDRWVLFGFKELLQVGNFFHFISRFVAGFAVGFSTVWQLSLVTLAIVPLIALAGGLYAFAVTGLMSRSRQAYIKAGGIAEEVRVRRSFS